MANEKVEESTNQSAMATFRCTICGDTFDDINVMEKHIYQRHNFKQSSEDFCDMCKTFVRDNLEEHICRTHNESVEKNDERKNCCSVCKKEFVHKSYLNIHIKVDHEGKKEFECNLCPKTFGADEYLRRHKSRLHSSSKTKHEQCISIGIKIYFNNLLQ